MCCVVEFRVELFIVCVVELGVELFIVCAVEFGVELLEKTFIISISTKIDTCKHIYETLQMLNMDTVV